MGIPLFGINISGLVAEHIGSGLPPATLIKKTPGTPSSSNLTAGTNPKSASHTCKGFVDTYKDSQVDGTLVKRGDRFVLLIGDTLPVGVVPEPTDEVIAAEVNGGQRRYVISDGGVSRDPAGATYTCHVRSV